jgi:hypothetical protein
MIQSRTTMDVEMARSSLCVKSARPHKPSTLAPGSVQQLLDRAGAASLSCCLSMEVPMPIKEVCSPVSGPGSKVGSGQPLSPGARSNPSRGERIDNVPPQPTHGRVGHGEEGSTVTIVGPSQE